MERFVLGVFSIDLGDLPAWLSVYATWIQGIVTIAALCATLWFSHRQVMNQRHFEQSEKGKDAHLLQIKNIAKAKVFIGRISSSLGNVSMMMFNSGMDDSRLQRALSLPISMLKTDIEMLKGILMEDLPQLNTIALISMAIGRAEQSIAALEIAASVYPPNRKTEMFDNSKKKVDDIYSDLHKFHSLFENDPNTGWITNGKINLTEG